MAKIIVRITESDLVNIVKRVLNERGGYDDPIQMTLHGGPTLGGLKKIIFNILNKDFVFNSAITDYVNIILK